MAHAFARTALAAIAASTSMTAVQAAAQDVVVMRRVIGPRAVNTSPTPSPSTSPTPSPTTSPTPTPTPAPTGSGPGHYYNWSVSPWVGGQACQAADQTRVVTCQRDDGVSVAEAYCSTNNSGPKPVAQRFVADSCTYSWTIGQWSDPTNTCGTSTQTRAVTCLSSDGTTRPDSACAMLGAKPATSQDVSLTTGCGYSWKAGDWGAVAPGCGASSQSRTVVCQRSDGTVIDDSFCPGGSKPPLTQVAHDTSTCTYSWVPGTYGPPSLTCGDATETRPIACVSSDGDAAADAQCTDTKPSTTMTSHETSGCPFTWTAGDYGAVVPACGATVQTRTVTCLRGDGQPVPDDSCKSVRPDTSKAATDYSTCTFAWVSGVYSDPTTTCGDTVQTRSVSCQRADGTTADASNCDAASKPDASMTSHQVSGCSFSWLQSGFGLATPACGASTQSQTVSCQRADGQAATDDQCAGAGPKPALTQAATDYSTCSFTWSYGQYSAPSTTCGTATSTRTATCTRSDGKVVDSGCSGSQEPLSQNSYQTSGCTFSWLKGDFGAAAPACGTSTQTRSISCQRSDGQAAVSASSCTDPMPATSQAIPDYTTCSYKWVIGDWQGSSATCGDTITQNRSVRCQRSTGDFVDAQFCSATQPPPSLQTISDFSSCTYSWRQTPGNWTSTCSPSATRTNSVGCFRSDGVNLSPNGDSFCDATSKPSTQDTGNLAGCTYAWSSTPGSWSSTCSTSATRPETVVCQRSGDSGTTTVPDASCSAAGSKPPAQDVGNVAGCTFSWSYSAYTAPSSTCGASTQTRTASCLRSDGTTMPDNSQCQATLGNPQALTLSTYQTSGCTYAPTYSYGACTPNSSRSTTGAQPASVASCLRSDGQQVDPSTQQCNQNVSSSGKSCTLTYVGTFGAYGACHPTTFGAAPGTQTAPITACTMNGSDGSSQVTSADYCPSQTKTQSCSVTYSFAGTYSNYSSCINSSQSATLQSCTETASDNTSMTVANSNCSPQTSTMTCSSVIDSDGFEGSDAMRTVSGTNNGAATTAIVSTPVYAGSSSMRLGYSVSGASFAYPYVNHDFPVVAGVTYSGYMWVYYAGSGSSGPYSYLFTPSAADGKTRTTSNLTQVTAGSTWTKVSFSFIAKYNGTGSVSTVNGDSSHYTYVDSFFVTQ